MFTPSVTTAQLDESIGSQTAAAIPKNVETNKEPVQHAQVPRVRQMRITDLCLNGDMQIRADLHQDTIVEYADRLRAGDQFPPVIVYHDAGAYLLVDGFHRVAAATEAGLAEMLCEVRTGSRREALIAALGANVQHGLRRSNADKRRAVQVALKEFSEMSDRAIADMCGVGNQLVGHVRDQLCDSHSTAPRVGKDGKKRQRSASSKKRQQQKAKSSEANGEKSRQQSPPSADEPVNASDRKTSPSSSAGNTEEGAAQADPFQLADGTEVPAADVADGWVTTKWISGKLKHIEAIRKPFTPIQKQWCSQSQRILLGVAGMLNQNLGLVPSPDDLYSAEDALSDLRNYVVTHPNYKHTQ